MEENSQIPSKPKMTVIFLDFDGVLNSEGSFLYEENRRKRWKEQGVGGKVMETLCNVCTSNFQEILYRYPDVKIVISSTWREFFDIPWLKEKLESYHIDSSRVIGVTPVDKVWGGNRGVEIATWLNEHPEVNHYIIIDDNDWGITSVHPRSLFVQTSWMGGGLTSEKMEEAIMKLSSKYRKALEDAKKEELEKKNKTDK